MGWFSSAGHLLASAGRVVARNPIAGAALSVIPGGGLARTVIGVGVSALAGAAANRAINSLTSSPSSLPALPGMPEALPGMPGANVHAGERSFFHNDPNIVAALQPFAISMHNLKQSFRAPKGYVIRHDEKGDPYGIPKHLAKKYLGWRPGAKPPFSAGDWRAVKTAHHVGKRLRKVLHEYNAAAKNIGSHGPMKTIYRAPQVALLSAPKKKG
jgi:hypothetical protein